MSRDKLLARGYCCGLGCQNCPYDPPHQRNNTKVMSSWKVLFKKIIKYFCKCIERFKNYKCMDC